ncbi:LysR family transcriptional regulator [Kiloniella majae]|uniref:LysR family transcriptional regulator n=1 Tax=Kiloniella majae TaxID=1938558 RepID=UPI000A27892E|nr:LysR family transcriptional regulator [Kiloniella majae]
MNLNEMAVFASVVEHESFTAAAKALGISKSAVSKQVSRLEDRLRIRLLNRTTRRLSLTEAGNLFFEKCQAVMDVAEQAEYAVSRLSSTPSGLLKINAPMSFGIKCMAPMLADFRTQFPEIEIDLVLNDQMVDLIEDGFDVGIRIGRLMDSRLIAKKISDCGMSIIAAPSYFAKGHTSVIPAELSGYNFLHYSNLNRVSGLKLIGENGTVTVPLTSDLSANNGDFILSAVQERIGFACMPDFICHDAIKENRVVKILPDWNVDTDNAIYVVYPINRNLPPKARVFIDFIADYYGE